MGYMGIIIIYPEQYSIYLTGTIFLIQEILHQTSETYTLGGPLPPPCISGIIGIQEDPNIFLILLSQSLLPGGGPPIPIPR